MVDTNTNTCDCWWCRWWRACTATAAPSCLGYDVMAYNEIFRALRMTQTTTIDHNKAREWVDLIGHSQGDRYNLNPPLWRMVDEMHCNESTTDNHRYHHNNHTPAHRLRHLHGGQSREERHYQQRDLGLRSEAPCAPFRALGADGASAVAAMSL